MAGSVVHVFVACLGVDREQVVDQFHGTDGGGILFVEFDCIHEVPSRVAPARRLHHLRTTHAIVRCVSIRLQKPFEVPEEVQRSFPFAAQCAVKGAGQQRVQVPPGNWIAPPGSNRSSGGGNETAEASGVKGRLRRPRERTGRNVSERRAGLENGDAAADPTELWGRPMPMGEHERISPIGPAGVMATACKQEGTRRNTGSPSGDSQFGSTGNS